MIRPYVLLTSSLVLIAIVGMSLVGSAQAKRSGSVVCKLKVKKGNKGKKRVVVCPRAPLRGKRGRRGRRGRPGLQGPQGVPGPAGEQGKSGAGSGLTLNFNAKLGQPFATDKTLFIGNFTIRATAEGNGACKAVELLVGGKTALVSVGSGKPFESVGAFKTRKILTDDTSNMFTAVSVDGVSTVSGIVGRKVSGGFCLVSGYVTGV